MERKHAITSASGAFKWLNCPMSPILELNVQSQQTQEQAEGTEAHSWLEKLLKGEDISECKDKSMAGHAKDCLNLIKKIEEKVGGFDQVFIEKKIALTKRMYGKADFAATYNKGDRILILDYKYGQGRPVSAENNPQLASYITALRHTLDVDPEIVVGIIYQPRAWDNEGDVRIWKATREELNKWEERLKTASDRVYRILNNEENSEYVPGSWCTSCNAIGICPAIIRGAEDTGIVTLTKGKPKLPEVKKLSNEELAELKKWESIITKWFKEAGNVMLARASKDGVKFPGWKLVEGRSSRRLVEDEDLILRTLKKVGLKDEEIYKKKINGIGYFEKILGKGSIDSLTEKPPGKLKLVREEAAGEEVIIKDTVKSLLGDITED